MVVASRGNVGHPFPPSGRWPDARGRRRRIRSGRRLRRCRRRSSWRRRCRCRRLDPLGLRSPSRCRSAPLLLPSGEDIRVPGIRSQRHPIHRARRPQDGASRKRRRHEPRGNGDTDDRQASHADPQRDALIVSATGIPTTTRASSRRVPDLPGRRPAHPVAGSRALGAWAIQDLIVAEEL